jgi:hypothetical protein
MSHERKQSLQEQLKTISVAVSLLLTLGGVVVSLFNYFTLAQLQPFGIRLNAIEKAQAEGDDIRDTLATKDQIISLRSMLDGRLKPLEDKVEYLYRIHIK